MSGYFIEESETAVHYDGAGVVEVDVEFPQFRRVEKVINVAVQTSSTDIDPGTVNLIQINGNVVKITIVGIATECDLTVKVTALGW